MRDQNWVIVLVENNDDDTLQFRRFATKAASEKMEVRTFRSLEELRTAVETATLYLANVRGVVTDFELDAGKDGLEVLEYLEVQMRDWAQRPVLAVWSDRVTHVPRVEQFARTRLPVRFIQKPIDHDEVGEVVRGFVRSCAPPRVIAA